MPHLGTQPPTGFKTTTKQSFSGDNSTTAFTLNRASSSATDLEIFVDNIQQEPTTAYSVSGTTLTFTEAPPTGTNNIYVVNRGGDQNGLLPPQDLGTTDYIFGDDISLQSDSAVINFGTDSDVTLTHNHNTGLDLNLAMTATTFEPDGDTAAGDNAAIGYTSAEGLILTGQGSTNDVTIKNDADNDVIEIPTGTTNVTIAGNLGVGGTVTGTGTSVFADLDISGDVDVDGTLEADAMTLNGTAITTTATLSTGISNGNVLVANASVVDNDFLRVDGTSIEGRSASELLSDIGGTTEATAEANSVALAIALG